MAPQIRVEIIGADQWQRLRDIRLRSLQDSPGAFGGKHDIESNESESQWREKFKKLDFLIATLDSEDIGIMSVEVLDGDHGATCWIGGCWTDPVHRGNGALKALFKYVNENSVAKGWQRQGLGVWTDNYGAIAAYHAIGFDQVGEKMPSESSPGRFYQHMVRNSQTH